MLRLLAVNTDTEPISTEKHELPTDDRDALKRTILDLLNKCGKNGHVLLGWNGELWLCSHTAKRGPSDTYYKERIKYHPYMAEVFG